MKQTERRKRSFPLCIRFPAALTFCQEVTLCFSYRLRIASFGPKDESVRKNEAGSTLSSDAQSDSEILTFEIEGKRVKKRGRKAEATAFPAKTDPFPTRNIRLNERKQCFSPQKTYDLTREKQRFALPKAAFRRVLSGCFPLFPLYPAVFVRSRCQQKRPIAIFLSFICIQSFSYKHFRYKVCYCITKNRNQPN